MTIPSTISTIQAHHFLQKILGKLKRKAFNMKLIKNNFLMLKRIKKKNSKKSIEFEEGIFISFNLFPC